MNARLTPVVVLALLSGSGCGPRWTLEDRTNAEPLTVAPRMTHAQTFAIESSHPIATVRTVAEDISVTSGKLRVEQSDSREGCSATRDFEGREGKWNPVPASGSVSLTDDRLELSASCAATHHATEVRVTFTNAGEEPVTFRWFVVAIANGEGSEDPPGDAFVRIRPAE